MTMTMRLEENIKDMLKEVARSMANAIDTYDFIRSKNEVVTALNHTDMNETYDDICSGDIPLNELISIYELIENKVPIEKLYDCYRYDSKEDGYILVVK